MRSNNPDILTIFKLLIVFFITVSPPKKVTQTLLSIKVHLQKERQRKRERDKKVRKKVSFYPNFQIFTVGLLSFHTDIFTENQMA